MSIRWYNRFSRLLCTSVERTYRRWTPAEDARLKSLVEKSSSLSWKEFASQLGTNRDRMSIRARWMYSLSPDITRGRWKRAEMQALEESEDALLSQGVKVHGRDWAQIANDIPGRTRKQCIERWDGSLNPALKYGRWSEQENKALRVAREFCLEGKWAQAAKVVGTRNRKQCRRRWLRLEAKEKECWLERRN